MSKKTLITAVSTAALVASIGFAYAQSTDEEAYNNANINGTVDNNVPKHWSRDSVNSDPYDTAAPTAAGPSTTAPSDSTMPADQSSSASTTTPSADANSPWAADTTSTPSTTTTTPSGSTSSYDSTTGAPANTTDAVNQSNSSLSTNTAPSETHVDLNSPNDPIYNMGNSSDERTPRADRN